MKTFSLYVMAASYVAAGINHFRQPKIYQRIMPSWLPQPRLLVYLSGIGEIVFGLLLIPPVTRPLAAWLLIALLIAVFPANVQMSYNYRHRKYFWLTILRLPLQGVLIAWAWLFTQPA